MKKLLNRARQALQPDSSGERSSALDQSRRSPTRKRTDVDRKPAPANVIRSDTISEDCQRIYTLYRSMNSKWRTDPHYGDLASDMKKLWSKFCDAGTQPNNHQQLIDFLKSVLEESQTSDDSPWKDLPEFKSVVEQKLQEIIRKDMGYKTSWTALNNLLARISLPPASIYDLRMVCLWNIRDILETSSVAVTLDMMKTLMMWLGGHIHWLQLQVLRAHSKDYPAEDLIILELGDVPSSMGIKLQPVVDLDRLNFWRKRIRWLEDSSEIPDPSMYFYCKAAANLLTVGIADVDEWKGEMPPK